jgi:hypothetical protein
VVGLNHLRDVLAYLKVETHSLVVNIPFIRQKLVDGAVPQHQEELLQQILQVQEARLLMK